jgi:hypothetical protein
MVWVIINFKNEQPSEKFQCQNFVDSFLNHW